MSESPKCVLCRQEFDENVSDKRCISVTQKGIKTLEKFALLREDSELSARLNDLQEAESKVTVHQNCRRDYTDPKRLPRPRSNSPQHCTKKLRYSSGVLFEWKSCCFLCGVRVTKDIQIEI